MVHFSVCLNFLLVPLPPQFLIQLLKLPAVLAPNVASFATLTLVALLAFSIAFLLTTSPVLSLACILPLVVEPSVFLPP